MKAFAILLDSRPGYLAQAAGPTSLLLTPLGPTSVLRYVSDRLSAAGHPRITIATAFDPEPEYERRIADVGVPVDGIVPARDLAARIADYEPSDWLVMVDPLCFPSMGLVPSALILDGDHGPRRVRHLVALEAHPGGTTERVQLGPNGTVGRIQRYYDSSTWPFTSGVACSLLPVSCTMGSADLPFASLRGLRRSLAERGVPSNDVFLRGGAFDLSQEQDFLELSERVVLDYFSGRRPTDEGWLKVGAGCEVDGSARLVGPVILHAAAVVGPGATVVGPAVIGPRARVERDAMVAQCVVGPDAVILPGLTFRHRAVFEAAPKADPVPPAAPVYYEPAPPPRAVESSEAQDRPRSSAYPILKAMVDATAATIGLLLLGPIFILVALAIRLESKGPVFYRDRREGEEGAVFECLKFRTMFTGAHAQQRELQAENQVDGPQFKLARDPRVTRVGRFLRASNLDELPQLLNVLRFDMSLVGPRPSPFRENQLCIPWRDARLSVRPGITGLWQICRDHRSEGDFHQWIHFDLLYVRHRSFMVDLKILVATVLTLGGQWPVPLAWILSRRQRGMMPGPIKGRSASSTGPAAPSPPSASTSQPSLDGRVDDPASREPAGETVTRLETGHA